MSKQQAQPGLVELMTYIDSKSLPKGICTRNFDMPVDHLLTKFLSAVKPFHPSQFKPCPDIPSPPLCCVLESSETHCLRFASRSHTNTV